MGIEQGSSRALQDDGAPDAMESATQRKRAPKGPAPLDGSLSPAHTATTASTTFSGDELDSDSAFDLDDDGDDDDLDAFLTDADLHAAVAADKEKERVSHDLRRKHKHKRRKQRLAAGRSGSVAWLLQTVWAACTPPPRQHAALALARVLLGLSFAWLLAALLWLRWPLYMQYVADPMTKALGDKLKAEVEPRVVVLALALPFIVTGVLFYALESRVSASSAGSSANGPTTWLLWLRRQRRACVCSSLDSVDVVAVAGFVLAQLNCFIGKLLIDQYTGKLAKAGLLPRAARSFGMNGLYSMILSILLVSRQSFVHSYLQLSSERAARYHVWTGNVGLFCLVLHGALYCVYWLERGELEAKLLPCFDCSSVEAYKTMRNFAGLVALACLVLVALASLEVVRRRHFRRFALVHCVNVLVVVFTCVHYYPAAFWFVPSVLAYVLYRVRARAGQGDATVLSAATLADKVVQLELRRDGSSSGAALDFEPGQYVYIQVPEISRFAWHPFTIASSPLKHRHAFHIDAKVHGHFTQQLLALIKSHRLLRVKVDGYYGTPIAPCAHMVFVAGGTGMTPFLSFLEHLQLRTEALAPVSGRSHSSTFMPKTLWVIWTCRDLELLDAHAELLHAISKSPHWQSKLWLHVTPTTRADDDPDNDWDTCDDDDARVEKFVPASMHRCAYTRDAGLAHQLALFVGASIGLALAMHSVYTADATVGRVWWLKRVLLLGAGAFGAAAGSALVLLVLRIAAKCRRRDPDRGVGSAVTELEHAGDDFASPVTPQTPRKRGSGPGGATLLQRSFTVASTRPDVSQRLRSIHSEIQENFGVSADVGVFVSGPAGLQTDAMRAASALHSPLVRVHQKSFTV